MEKIGCDLSMKIRRIYLFFWPLLAIAFISLVFLPACSLLDRHIVDLEEIDDLKNENALLKEDNRAMADELSSLKASFEDLRSLNKDLQENSQQDSETISKLQEEVDRLEKTIEGFDYDGELASLRQEVEGLKTILEGFEQLLSNVYIGMTEPMANYSFTAFSLKYEDKYYIITAGHCVNDNLRQDNVFKFKANFSEEWIYPELIGYNAAFWELDDYAVFYSDDLMSGLEIGKEPSSRNYLLGSLDKGLNIFRYVGDSSIRGESGSPVINLYGKVVGIYVVYGTEFTPIELATGLIDSYFD